MIIHITENFQEHFNKMENEKILLALNNYSYNRNHYNILNI
jgi:hypothetical protein